MSDAGTPTPSADANRFRFDGSQGVTPASQPNGSPGICSPSYIGIPCRETQPPRVCRAGPSHPQ